MKKSYFKRLFLLYAVILVIALGISEIYITSAVRENHLDELKKTLSAQIDIISDRIVFGAGAIDGLCIDLKKKTGSRVTVILPEGKVIGDSDSSSVNMEDHSQRTEIAQARIFGVGSLIRHSDTLKTDYLYYAKKIMIRGEIIGFIRLAVPLTDIYTSVNRLRVHISLIIVLALFVMWLIAVWQTDQMRRLVGRLRELSSSLAGGEIDKRLFMKTGGEFGEIAGNLVAMSGKLRGLLKQSEEERIRLNAILQSIPDALLIIDTRGIVQLANAAATTLFSDMSVMGRHYMEVVRSNAFSELIEDIQKKPDIGSARIRLEIPLERHFNALVSPLYYNESEIAGFVIVLHDITRLEKLEQVRKDFVANMSHEIKTPITAIKGFSETLLEGAVDDRENAMRFLEAIRQNSERINNLVDDLLALSGIELGVISVNKAQVDVREIIDQVISILGSRANEKNLELKPVVHGNVAEIAADRDRLIQIFTNLVDNAIKFTESGQVTFGSSVTDGKPVLFVEDTGIGVPAKSLPRLGERFYRVDTARSRKMGGTGLGLAIVKHLVKAHGWDMKIDSLPGKGTVVRIYL
jgi:two-component system, OmpR family, phosphate regulon sensor histidine kinase PhoR